MTSLAQKLELTKMLIFDIFLSLGQFVHSSGVPGDVGGLATDNS